MINLQDYGKMVSKQEFIVNLDENKHRLITGLYIGEHNTYDKGFITLSIEPDENNLGYNCKICSNNKGEINLKTAKIDNLSTILSYADSLYKMKSEDESVDTPITVWSYNNAKKKNDEYFFVDVNDIELEIFKHNKLIIDNNYFAEEETSPLNFNSHYEFHNYGIFCNDNNTEKMYLLNNDKSTSPSADYIDLSNIQQNPYGCTAIQNLNNLPRKITFYNDSEVMLSDELTYDSYFGILTDSFNCLYEVYFLEDQPELPAFSISLHPFWFDNFDTEILPSTNNYCVDQVDRSIDEDSNIIIYSREIYQIDDDKLEALCKEIEEEKLKNTPSIKIID